VPDTARCHCFAARLNCNYYKIGLVHRKLKVTRPPIYLDFSDNLDAVDANGHVPVPWGPGLGVKLDWDWITQHEVGKGVYE
jgi:L-alanine-DL-glutamate epimerase-like enolase superfamily enzyme